MAEGGREGPNAPQWVLEKVQKKLSLLCAFDTQTSDLGNKLLSLKHELRADIEGMGTLGDAVDVISVEDLRNTIRTQLCLEGAQTGSTVQSTPDIQSLGYHCHEEVMQVLKEEALAALQRAEEEAPESDQDLLYISSAGALSALKETVVALQMCKEEGGSTVREVVADEGTVAALPDKGLPQESTTTKEVEKIRMDVVKELRSCLEDAVRSDKDARRKNLHATCQLEKQLSQNAAMMRQHIQVLLSENEAIINHTTELQKDIDAYRSQLSSLRCPALESSGDLVRLLPEARAALVSTERIPPLWESTTELSQNESDTQEPSCFETCAEVMKHISAFEDGGLAENLQRTLAILQEDLQQACDVETSGEEEDYSEIEALIDQLGKVLSTWEHQPARWCSKNKVGGYTFAEWMQLLEPVKEEALAVFQKCNF